MIDILPGSDQRIIETPNRRILRIKPTSPHYASYMSDEGLAVVLSFDTEAHGTLFHLSVSRPRRVPTWAEMIDVWTALRTDNPMLVLPNWTKHKSVHDHCLHFYSIPSTWSGYVNQTIQTTLPHPQTTAQPPSAKFAPVRLKGAYTRLKYPSILAYRQTHYSPSDDVLVFFDLHQRSLRHDVFLMLTPEPWQAGAAV